MGGRQLVNTPYADTKITTAIYGDRKKKKNKRRRELRQIDKSFTLVKKRYGNWNEEEVR